MQAAAFEDTGTSLGVSRIDDKLELAVGLELGVLGALAGVVESSGAPWGFPSSFFHI